MGECHAKCGYQQGDARRGDAVEVEAPIVEVVLEAGVPPWGYTIQPFWSLLGLKGPKWYQKGPKGPIVILVIQKKTQKKILELQKKPVNITKIHPKNKKNTCPKTTPTPRRLLRPRKPSTGAGCGRFHKLYMRAYISYGTVLFYVL